MRLFLSFIEGPARGKKLSITKTTSIGRTDAEIPIDDPKLSGTHAFFKLTGDGEWTVIDNGSRNGVWINGIKEVRYNVKDQDVVQIGSTLSRCRLLQAKQQKLSESFQYWVQELGENLKNGKSQISEVKPELRLKVIQGVQFGESWDVFYGPRFAGRDSLDICLYEDKAPKDSFEILVKGGYPYFKTKNQSVVKINQQNITEKQFEPGDIISIGETQIVVEFDEGHGFSS